MLAEALVPDGAFEADALGTLVEQTLRDDQDDLDAALAEDAGGQDDLSVMLERIAIAESLRHSSLDDQLAWLASDVAR